MDLQQLQKRCELMALYFEKSTGIALPIRIIDIKQYEKNYMSHYHHFNFEIHPEHFGSVPDVTIVCVCYFIQ
jgi:hypothetical protein